MKTLLLGLAAAALVATGVVLGRGLSETRDEADAPPTATAPEPEIVYRTLLGETRTLSASQAADRLESLERQLARKQRGREGAAESESGEPAPPQPAADPPPSARLRHPDGRPFSTSELIVAARESADATLRAEAIRELRRADTDDARSALRAILADKATPQPLREEAAKALTQWPNRDKLPEELVAALREETDPAVRRVLAQGVGRMNGREAWMTDIVAMVHEEKDAEVRKALFEAVLRDARDPVARGELVAVAADAGASLDERRAALAALPRGRTDAETLARLALLLSDPDARVREHAVSLVGSAQALSPSTLAAALADADPGVRRAALSNGAGRLPQFANDKTLPKPEYEALVERTVTLAASDPDPSVRRAAVQQVGNLPKGVRDQVLAAGRDDPDLFVKITSYARSPEAVAKTGTGLFVSSLDSSDAAIRDFAYRQLQRLSRVTAPFDARWNAKARTEAIGRIRQELAASGR